MRVRVPHLEVSSLLASSAPNCVLAASFSLRICQNTRRNIFNPNFLSSNPPTHPPTHRMVKKLIARHLVRGEPLPRLHRGLLPATLARGAAKGVTLRPYQWEGVAWLDFLRWARG